MKFQEAITAIMLCVQSADASATFIFHRKNNEYFVSYPSQADRADELLAEIRKTDRCAIKATGTEFADKSIVSRFGKSDLSFEHVYFGILSERLTIEYRQNADKYESQGEVLGDNFSQFYSLLVEVGEIRMFSPKALRHILERDNPLVWLFESCNKFEFKSGRGINPFIEYLNSKYNPNFLATHAQNKYIKTIFINF
jgi:hypothetical protein